MISAISRFKLFQNLELLDSVSLNFSSTGLIIMNIAIAFVMFGVALEIKPANFRKVFTHPKPAIVGLISQYLILPAISYLLILLIQPTPAVALGMILVASCPGGNISNFISSLAKANVALSVSLTAISTILCIFMTPLNFAIWGGLYAKKSPLLVPIEIDLIQIFYTVVLLLAIPVALGMLFAHYMPIITKKISKAIKTTSIILFISFVAIAFIGNYSNFINYITIIFAIVLFHNALALLFGYSLAAISGLEQKDRRTISIETGIQNSALGLALIFNPKIFPQEANLGGMAFIAAWWGIWHIISGFFIAYLWSKPKLKKT